MRNETCAFFQPPPLPHPDVGILGAALAPTGDPSLVVTSVRPDPRRGNDGGRCA